MKEYIKDFIDYQLQTLLIYTKERDKAMEIKIDYVL
jgi:hypothetical protein